jgi:sulfite exporter TauE/SafE
MCTCGNHGSEIVSIVHNKDILELIFNIIIFGITNSFTHCIGMCGSIAMGQSAMRMIAIIKKPTTLEKIISCVAWEYYIGKAITYSLLTFIIIFYVIIVFIKL